MGAGDCWAHRVDAVMRPSHPYQPVGFIIVVYNQGCNAIITQDVCLYC